MATTVQTSVDTGPLSIPTKELKAAPSPPNGEVPVANKLQEPVFVQEKAVPAATKLRKLLADTDKLIVCPGVYDGLSARIALDVGFDALYMVSMSVVRDELENNIVRREQAQRPPDLVSQTSVLPN